MLNQRHRDPLFLAFFTDNIFIVNEKELLFNLKRYYQIKPSCHDDLEQGGPEKTFHLQSPEPF